MKTKSHKYYQATKQRQAKNKAFKRLENGFTRQIPKLVKQWTKPNPLIKMLVDKQGAFNKDRTIHTVPITIPIK